MLFCFLDYLFNYFYVMLFFIDQEDKSPFPGSESEHIGCVFCDPIFKPLMEKHHAAALRRGPRAARGGGRGRGGRGRGRGRGRGKPKDKMSQLAAYFV